MEGGREMFSFGYNGLYLARAPNPVDLKKKKKKAFALTRGKVCGFHISETLNLCI